MINNRLTIIKYILKQNPIINEWPNDIVIDILLLQLNPKKNPIVKNMYT